MSAILEQTSTVGAFGCCFGPALTPRFRHQSLTETFRLNWKTLLYIFPRPSSLRDVFQPCHYEVTFNLLPSVLFRVNSHFIFTVPSLFSCKKILESQEHLSPPFRTPVTYPTLILSRFSIWHTSCLDFRLQQCSISILVAVFRFYFMEMFQMDLAKA